jgi:hypothetical protein
MTGLYQFTIPLQSMRSDRIGQLPVEGFQECNVLGDGEATPW